jgi:predicted 2-oxoglutarate/Fe(II)-dependent dioxygenase YbiX
MPDLSEYILILKDFMAADDCAKIAAEYSNYAVRALVEGNVEHPSRTCSQIMTDLLLEAHTKQAIRTYRNKFPDCRIETNSGWLYVKYDEGQFYKQHVDEFPGKPRLVTISVALNDDYEGGEWAWFDRQIVASFRKGDAVMFPSNWMFPHEILPVTEGTRHALITWFSGK